MSAIASFIKVPKTALDGLRRAASQGGYHGFFHQHGRPVADYRYSGYLLATLLCYLQEQHQVDLMHSEHDELSTFLTNQREATHFIFTNAHRQACLDKLDPQLFSEARLRDFHNEINETDEPEVGQPLLDGIRALRQSLSALDESSVIVFSIV